MNFSGLTYGEDIVFECMTYANILKTLFTLTPDDSVIGTFGGNIMSETFLSYGFTFSASTMNSGLSIGYGKRAEPFSISQLFYVQAFSWDLYLMMLLLPAVLGFALYVFQLKNQNLLNYIHQFYSYYFKIDFLKMLNVESRLQELVFQFAMMVVIALYVAQVTNVLADQKGFEGVSTVDDLRGERITYVDYYKDFIGSLGGRFVPLVNQGHLHSKEEIEESFWKTDCPFFMLDSPLLEWFIRGNCEFSMVFRDVFTTNYGVLWHPFAPRDLIDKMDLGIMYALETKNQTTRFEETLFLFDNSTIVCDRSASSSVISFSDVSSLWVVWLILLVIGILAYVLSFFIKKYRRTSRTLYDLEIRGNSEESIKTGLASDLVGGILISLASIQKQKAFVLENTRYCYQKMKLNPDLRKRVHSLVSSDVEMQELIASFTETKKTEGKLVAKRKSTFQRLFTRKSTQEADSPRSPKKRSGEDDEEISRALNCLSRQTEQTLVSSPNNARYSSNNYPALKENLEKIAGKYLKETRIRFSEQQIERISNNYIDQQEVLQDEKERVVEELSSKLHLEIVPMYKSVFKRDIKALQHQQIKQRQKSRNFSPSRKKEDNNCDQEIIMSSDQIYPGIDSGCFMQNPNDDARFTSPRIQLKRSPKSLYKNSQKFQKISLNKRMLKTSKVANKMSLQLIDNKSDNIQDTKSP